MGDKAQIDFIAEILWDFISGSSGFCDVINPEMLRCDSEEALLIAIFVTASMHCTLLVSSIIDSNPRMKRFFRILCKMY